jgi:hypothetical protein
MVKAAFPKASLREADGSLDPTEDTEIVYIRVIYDGPVDCRLFQHLTDSMGCPKAHRILHVQSRRCILFEELARWMCDGSGSRHLYTLNRVGNRWQIRRPYLVRELEDTFRP